MILHITTIRTHMILHPTPLILIHPIHPWYYTPYTLGITPHAPLVYTTPYSVYLKNLSPLYPKCITLSHSKYGIFTPHTPLILHHTPLILIHPTPLGNTPHTPLVYTTPYSVYMKNLSPLYPKCITLSHSKYGIFTPHTPLILHPTPLGNTPHTPLVYTTPYSVYMKNLSPLYPKCITLSHSKNGIFTPIHP